LATWYCPAIKLGEQRKKLAVDGDLTDQKEEEEEEEEEEEQKATMYKGNK
jgi:hypothetical protein